MQQNHLQVKGEGDVLIHFSGVPGRRAAESEPQRWDESQIPQKNGRTPRSAQLQERELGGGSDEKRETNQNSTTPHNTCVVRHERTMEVSSSCVIHT
jgi:hypothetical protein